MHFAVNQKGICALRANTQSLQKQPLSAEGPKDSSGSSALAEGRVKGRGVGQRGFFWGLKVIMTVFTHGLGLSLAIDGGENEKGGVSDGTQTKMGRVHRGGRGSIVAVNHIHLSLSTPLRPPSPSPCLYLHA